MNARKKSSLARLSQTVVLTLSAVMANAAEISGYILDYDTAEPVADAQLEINGQLISIDEEGYFSVDVDSSQITASVSAPGYEGSSKTIAAVDGQINNLSMSLMSVNRVEDDDEYETSEVIGRYVPPSAAANERDAKAVLDSIGSEELSRSGDSNVASALKRVVGLNLRDNSFVTIRGLDGRYIAAEFNGSILPSLNSSRREIPLGIIPSGVLEGIDVQKGFTADLQGISTGGTIKLTTQPFPESSTFKFSIGGSYNSAVYDADLRTRTGSGGMDFAGIDDGYREIPPELKNEIDPDNPNSSNFDSRAAAAQGLNVNYNTESYEPYPGLSLDLALGNSWRTDNWRFGYFLSGSYGNETSVRLDGKERYYQQGSGNILNSADYERYRQSVDLSSMLTLGASYNNRHHFTINSLLTRKTEDTSKFSQGFDRGDKSLDDIRYVSHEWEERQFWINQFVAEHDLQTVNINWGVASIIGSEYTPDALDYTFNDDRTGLEEGEVALSFTGINRQWKELSSDGFTSFLDLQFPLDEIHSGLIVETGVSSYDNSLEGEEYSISMRSNVPVEEITTSDLDDFDFDSLVTPDALTDRDFLVVNNTTGAGFYEGEESINALYLRSVIPFEETWLMPELSLGVRNETGEISAESSSPTNASTRVAGGFEFNDVLPEAGLKLNLSNDLILRGNYSQTVARPVFREITLVPYKDDDFDLSLTGNPDLKQSNIQNFDLRFEYYFSESESITFAAFIKELDDPIERRPLISSSSTDQFTIQNQDSASIRGIELDFRKEFIIDLGNVHNLFIQGNGALIDSEVKLNQDSAAAELGTDVDFRGYSRELQGQPNYIVNLQLGYDNILYRQSVSLLYNQTGKQIFSPGVDGQGSIIEEPYTQLDFTYKYKFSDNYSISFKAKNLLDADRKLTQRGNTFESYRTGTDFSLSFSGNL